MIIPVGQDVGVDKAQDYFLHTLELIIFLI